MSDSFERRLVTELRAYADSRTRPVDAVAVAQVVIGSGRARPLSLPYGPRVRLGALLAAAAVTLLLIGFAIGVGSSHRLLADGSPTPPSRSDLPVVFPTPVASSELMFPGGGWWLDWSASGLAVPRSGGPNGPEIFSVLTFTPDAVQLGQGAGGGCESDAAPYAIDGSTLTIGITDTPSPCGGRSPTAARHRLAQTARFTQGTEPCALPPEMADASLGPNPPCRTLRLLDRTGAVLLVYRDIGDLFGGCCLPTADPGILLLAANRWRLDWVASGLDGHVNRAIAEPIVSTLDVDTAGTFGVWQGYGPSCDHFAGTVTAHSESVRFKLDAGASGCDPVVTQAVRDQLARAYAFFVDVESCTGSSSPDGSAGTCTTLHIDNAGGTERLIYRALP